MIHLPLIFNMFYIFPEILILLSIIINTVIHYIVDDLKANKYKINLVIDQSIHFIQIILTFILFFIIL